MEDIKPMDVDDSSPPGAKEDPNDYNAFNREFLENVQDCKITLGKNKVEDVLGVINAVLNSGGGIVRMTIDDFSSYKLGELVRKLDTFWQLVEKNLVQMIFPSAYDDVFDKKRKRHTILLFIKATENFCTMKYNFHLPFDVTSPLFVPREKVVELLSRRNSLENQTPEVPLTELAMELLPEKFTYGKVLQCDESKTLQLKRYTSENGLFHDFKNQNARDQIAKYVSGFGNGSGGMILVGIEDETREILGQDRAAFNEAYYERGFQRLIEKISKTWSFTPKQGEHWDIKFSPVDGNESSFMVMVLIAGMRNLGGIFTKCPESFKLQNPSGSDGKERIVKLKFDEWKQRMLSGTCLGQSKGTMEASKKFRVVRVLDGPLLTVKGSVEEIVEAFFPVGPGCPVVPKGFESNLPEEAKMVIREIQEQVKNGLIVASPSMLSTVQKEEQRKEDGVICDLLLLSESLGRLHLISLVSSGSQDQFFPHARATAKAVKNSLVMNGGCYEKFYITCQVVLCNNREGTESYKIPSPDSRYPEEYHQRSSPQGLGKINRILQSLVISLAQIPSFLSNKQGVSFLNLLTKEQFELLNDEIDEHRELWINGPAGTGKSLVAVEFMRKLRSLDRSLTRANILYVCERPEIMAKIRKLEVCECRTRETFMKENFPQIRHVILDEVQNFQAKDGDWLEKARGLVKQSQHTDGPGYLWCFMDKGQGINEEKAGIPNRLPQTFRLTKVIRNSKAIFDHAELYLNRRFHRGSSATIGHDFDGERSQVLYPTGKKITCLIEELKSLLKEGYSKGDIAVLCLLAPLEGNERDQVLLEFPSTVSAERDDEDNIVLSTAEKYGGLERPVVIIVWESLKPYREDLVLDHVRYCARTRAMVKLVTLKRELKGQKRKTSN